MGSAISHPDQRHPVPSILIFRDSGGGSRCSPSHTLEGQESPSTWSPHLLKTPRGGRKIHLRSVSGIWVMQACGASQWAGLGKGHPILWHTGTALCIKCQWQGRCLAVIQVPLEPSSQERGGPHIACQDMERDSRPLLCCGDQEVPMEWGSLFLGTLGTQQGAEWRGGVLIP
jgi:hypothetical protein